MSLSEQVAQLEADNANLRRECCGISVFAESPAQLFNIHTLAAEVEKLRAIVAKLPVTADGVPVVEIDLLTMGRQRDEARAGLRLEIARHPNWGRPWMEVSDADVDSVIEGAAELGVKAWEDE